MTQLLRSESLSAALLLGAALVGLITANLPFGEALLDFKDTVAGIPGTGLDLNVGEWVSDGLLAIFFLVVSMELKMEMRVGQLSKPSQALRPAIAAAGGVIVPALVFVAFNASGPYLQGWPIPTATDIAFAVGILAMFGRFVPRRLRTFVLALAILDDLVGIVFIAVFFTSTLHPRYILAAAACVLAFGLLSTLLRSPRHRGWVTVVLIPLGVLTWVFMYQSGVHATIAGVALGFAMARPTADTLRHHLDPFVNVLVLPVFAFTAALVSIPSVPLSSLSSVFWGIVVALPVGKLVGITLGSWLSSFLDRDQQSEPFREMLTVGCLAGIGFTISLLMNELAFEDAPEIINQGTVAVLLGSMIAMIASGILVSWLSRHYRNHPEQLPLADRPSDRCG